MMMVCEVFKIDSNVVGLRYAEEECIGELPTTGVVWHPLEPNSYQDTGAEYNQVTRDTINASRQRRKGTVVGETATIGFEHDFVQKSLYTLMEGFLFADWREKLSMASTATTTISYTVANSAGMAIGDLILAENFAIDSNNGLKEITNLSVGNITVNGGAALETTAPADAKVTRVGVKGDAGDLEISVTAGVASLISTTYDFTGLGVIPGEWIYIGGDNALNQFATAANNGWVRVKSVAANEIVLDRQSGMMVTDNGAGQEVHLYLGHVLKNEATQSLILRKSYAFERTFATDIVEYINGCVANTLDISMDDQSIVTVTMGFLGLNAEAATAVKAGDRPTAEAEEAFNSSLDMGKFRMLNENTAATLFTYVTGMNLTINNNLSPLTALGKLGALDFSAGDFTVTGSTTAYFTSDAAVSAIKNNTSVSMELAMSKDNAGWVFDLPLVSLGDGKKNVTQGEPVTLPLTLDAVGHPDLDHTMLVQSFSYLPTAASTQ